MRGREGGRENRPPPPPRQLLAKLGSGMHKPAQQTVLPLARAPALLRGLPLGRLRGLGGPVLGGALAAEFGAATAGDLWAVSEAALVARFGDGARPPGGRWIYRVVRGVCLEPVKDRELALTRVGTPRPPPPAPPSPLLSSLSVCLRQCL